MNSNSPLRQSRQSSRLATVIPATVIAVVGFVTVDLLAFGQITLLSAVGVVATAVAALCIAVTDA